jgi:hypothetical protein
MVSWFNARTWTAGLRAVLLLSLATNAQSAKQQVIVGGEAYLVDGDAVSRQGDGQQPDDVMRQKAIFTARVLDELILNSEFAKELFSAETRASVLADQVSGRLVEPWRKPLLTGQSVPAAFVAAKERYKEWATKLASDPQAAAVAIARKDYLDGIGAFRENAEIYRKVTKQNGTLTYEAAWQFLRNQMPMTRLAYARQLEQQVAPPTASGGKSTIRIDQGSADQFRQQVQAEVGSRLDSEIKSVADLDARDDRISRIAESRFAGLRSYRDAVRPPTVNFGGHVGAGQSSVSPDARSTVATFHVQQKITITVPAPPPKSAAAFDMTGGIFLPPPGARNAPGGAAPSSLTGLQGGNNALPPSSGVTPGASSGNLGSDFGQAGMMSPGANQTATGDQPGRTDPGRGTREPYYTGDAENLKVYSSKPYHNNAGWIFNPRTGMWQDPSDPADMILPAVIICCDDTGLAFPSDAVEAKES